MVVDRVFYFLADFIGIANSNILIKKVIAAICRKKGFLFFMPF